MPWWSHNNNNNNNLEHSEENAKIAGYASAHRAHLAIKKRRRRNNNNNEILDIWSSSEVEGIRHDFALSTTRKFSLNNKKLIFSSWCEHIYTIEELECDVRAS